tara:strand:- start:5997 stop:7049 length:1053 start_codon:yes stop_codon:yes gene_type:complete
MKNILVTGGAGFIGSHTCITLLEKGYKLIVIDSNINSSPDSLFKIRLIVEKKLIISNQLIFKKGNIGNFNFLREVFLSAKKENNQIDAVIHFAGLKSIEESIKKPLLYWENNVYGTIILLKVMREFNCKNIVFSSSASIYGKSNLMPINETNLVNPINTYGQTKVAIENILKDIYIADGKSWKIANLRYFNPIGAHPSGILGENPTYNANNLFPEICKVAASENRILKIFGKDWPTPDGTTIRDYIHVMDLAEAHENALSFILNNEPQILNLNIGTGLGISILDLVRKFIKINNCLVPFKFYPRRIGDVPILIADNHKAISILKWKPTRDLDAMCKDGWKWQRQKMKNIC